MSESAVSPAPSRGSGASDKLLAPEVLFGIASLEMRARAIAEGVLAGIHRSRRFGSSSEFAEHKQYTPGDDLRHLDWKAFARMDRYFVRRYEEETNLDVHLVLDCSGSMAYAGGARGSFGISKLEYARTLVAGLAYLAHRQSDGCSLQLFAGDERTSVPPSARADHLRAIFQHLERVPAEGPSEAVAALERVSSRMSRRALVVLVSDLLDVGTDALGPLGVLRKRGADVLCLHVLDADEIEFPFDGVVRFEDLEGDREVQVDAPAVREAYLEELALFLSEIRQGASTRDLRYHLADTRKDPAALLKRALLLEGAGRRGPAADGAGRGSIR